MEQAACIGFASSMASEQASLNTGHSGESFPPTIPCHAANYLLLLLSMLRYGTVQCKACRASLPQTRGAEQGASISRNCSPARANPIPRAQQRATAQHGHRLRKQQGSAQWTSALLSPQAGNETHSHAVSDTGNSLGWLALAGAEEDAGALNSSWEMKPSTVRRGQIKYSRYFCFCSLQYSGCYPSL